MNNVDVVVVVEYYSTSVEEMNRLNEIELDIDLIWKEPFLLNAIGYLGWFCGVVGCS